VQALSVISVFSGNHSTNEGTNNPIFLASTMTRIATLRCPCVHDDNYASALRTLKALAEFGYEDVRYSPNLQKPNHSAVFIDVHGFLDRQFAIDFQALQGKECLKVFLNKRTYVLVGIGKSQEECDAEVAAAEAANAGVAAPQGDAAEKK